MIWQILAFFIGVGVMAAPDLLSLGGTVADAFHVLGPIAASIGGISIAAVLRSVRRAHLLAGPAIAAAPILLGAPVEAILVGLVAGAALVALAFPGAARSDQYGGGWRAVFQMTEPRTTPDDHPTRSGG